MATFYLDFENGNDTNDGTTFANRWKTLTSGATAVRCAAGSVIRVMGSPAPTLVGTATWRTGSISNTISSTSLTNATPIVVTASGHGFSTGDFVYIDSSTVNTRANGMWSITVLSSATFSLDGSVGNCVGTASNIRLVTNRVVTLASAVTQNIASFGNGATKVAWTASANASSSVATGIPKEGTDSTNIQVTATFTTGLAAYLPTGTLNLSGYQQVSFWAQLGGGSALVTTGQMKLVLCSDALGVTIVNTITIPPIAATGQWYPFTVDTGGALGASIQSIALYINTDAGGQSIVLDNIIACKASSSDDSLSLTSLISKNTTGEGWWAIQSINGTRVVLLPNVPTTALDANGMGYYGVTESVSTYKRETIKFTPAISAGSTIQTVQFSGAAGNPTILDGGWDRTAMTTKNLKTFLDGVNGLGIPIDLTNRSFITISNFAYVRADSAASVFNAPDITFDSLETSSCASFFRGSLNSADRISFTGTTFLIQTGANFYLLHGKIADFLSISSPGGTGVTIQNGNASKIASMRLFNYYATLSITGIGLYIGNLLLQDSPTGAGGGISFTADSSVVIDYLQTVNIYPFGTLLAGTSASGGLVKIRGGSSDTTNGSAVRPGAFTFVLRNYAPSNTTEVTTISPYIGGVVRSENHDNIVGNHKFWHAWGMVVSDAATRHTAYGLSWKMTPTITGSSAAYPLKMPLGEIAVKASALVTITAWVRRDNLGLSIGIFVKALQLSGITTDQSAIATGSINTWEQVTITFTPTEAGGVALDAIAYGGTTYTGYIDDIMITQA
jgi:hypothetical protein